MMSTKALKQLQKSTIKSKRRMKLKYGCSMSKTPNPRPLKQGVKH